MATRPPPATPRHRRHREARAAALALALALSVVLGAAAVNAVERHRFRSRDAPAMTLALPPGGPVWPPKTHRDQRSRELAALRRAERRTAYVSGAGRRRREVALTFDDGPGPYTTRVLRVLRRMHAPATFFQVGFMINDFPTVERALLADRNVALGDHTETHAMLSRLPRAAQYGQINDAAAAQALHGAHWPHLFRPPYGAFNHATLRTARQLHMLTVLWTVDSRDYLQPGVSEIVGRVLRSVRPGAIVLMHDAGGTRTQTIQALPTIIRRLRASHYRLVTVPRLLLDDPPRSPQPTPPTEAG